MPRAKLTDRALEDAGRDGPPGVVEVYGRSTCDREKQEAVGERRIEQAKMSEPDAAPHPV